MRQAAIVLLLLYPATSHGDDKGCETEAQQVRIRQHWFEGATTERQRVAIAKELARSTQDLQQCVERRKREQEEAEKSAEIARKDAEYDAKLRANPKAMQAILSARVCGFVFWRKSTMIEIGKQRHYSSLGGAVNLVVMYKLQQRVRALDEHIADDQQELRRLHVKPMGCATKEVQFLLECASGDSAVCSEPPIDSMVSIVNELDDEIDPDE